MFTRTLRLLTALCLFGALPISAAVLYVDLNSTNPIPPFSSWATAATNIQDAVDAASTGDEVLVTNGIYQSGGRVLPGSLLTNRLVLTNAITVQSVNGPLVTTIAGYQIPGDITGDSAVRCVFLANGAALTGFTITSGATLPGGNDVEAGGDTSGAGILCPLGDLSTVSNCIFVSNVTGDFGAGIYGGTMYNCLVVSNTAQLGSYGGGTFGGNYYNCTITANIAGIGAGDAFGNLVNCIVYGNDPDGGNYGFSTLNYCCTTPDPGGTGNIIADPLFVNPATGNFHLQAGSPCVNAGNNAYATTPTDLAGNPRIAGGTVDMGAYEVLFHYVDQNGTNPVPPFSSWATAATNIQDAVDAATNYDEVLVTNGIFQQGGRPAPGPVLTNRLVVTNAITIQSVNGPSATVIQGFRVPGSLGYGTSAIRCAYLDGGAELIGFTLTNGATLPNAFLNAADSGGGAYSPQTNATLYNCVVTGNLATEQGAGVCNLTLINCALVRNVCSNGTGSAIAGAAAYSTLTNCLIAQNTAQGGGAVAYSSLNNCTVSNNNTFGVGGGAYESILSNCILVKNVALLCGGAAGSTLNSCTLVSNIGINDYGGAYQCTLSNCLLSGNSVLAPFPGDAGGAAASDLFNCTVVSNTAPGSGGGVFDCTLSNCIVVSNSAPTDANYVLSPTNFLSFCCTTPLPTNGLGNVTNDPAFVDLANNDFHLQSNSPCINAGNNSYVVGNTDLDGNPRISGGTVDIGAYEFQNPASIISYAWLDQYSLPTDGSADFVDSDHNGMNNWQKWIAGLDPTNPSSILQMLAPAPSGTNLVVTWQSVTNITYYLQRATDLSAVPAFQSLATNLPGQASKTSYTDTNAPAPGPYFYRVGVQTQ